MAPRRWHWHLPDAAFASIAAPFGWASLAYPFCRDQGLFHYVGREWFVRGAIPYRDAVDHKPPGIYVVHGLLFRIFGEGMWPIRLFDLMQMTFIGFACNSMLRPPARSAEAPVRGLLGICLLATFLFYYGFFPHWDTAESESTGALLCTASLLCAVRVERRPIADVTAGLLAGCALVIKPTFVWLGVASAIFLAVRAARSTSEPGLPPTADVSSTEPAPRQVTNVFRRRKAKAIALAWSRYLAAVIVVPLLTAAYFAAHGAAAEMALWVIRVNMFYVEHERTVHGMGDVWKRSKGMFFHFEPLSIWGVVIVAAVIARAIVRKDRRTLLRFVGILGLFVATYVSVVMQLKFFRLHWVSVVPGAALMSGALYLELRAVVRERVRMPVPDAALAVAFVAGVVGLYAFSNSSTDIAWRGNRDTYRWLTGALTREQFTETFTIPELGYSYHDAELAGLWLREHSAPDDNVAVRGFEPEVYAVAHRRYYGRFYWTQFITDPRRAYLAEQWLAEETKQIDAHPPRYAVTVADDAPVFGTSWFTPRGYVQVAQFGVYRILAHASDTLQP